MTMKISQLALVCGMSVGLLGGTVGCTEESSETGDEQNATSALNDTLVNTALAGGCNITIQKTGKTQKTKGSGGKCPNTVTGVIDALKADTNNKLHFFVVSEQGTEPGKNTPYRSVIAVETKGNGPDKLFLSILGDGNGFNDDFLEVIAFNKSKGFVYYDIEDGAWQQVGDASMVPTDPSSKQAFRCQGCHTDGSPFFKELHDSWANWHSTWFTMPPSSSKQALSQTIFSNMERADDLETIMIDAMKTHAKMRVDKAVKEKKLNFMAKQLLCDVGSPSLIAAHSKNSKRLGDVQTFSSMVPSSLLLNNLFQSPRTGTGTEDGLTNILNMPIPSLSSVGIKSDSYVKAVKKMGQKIGGQAGDAIFPMLTPQKSFADLLVVQELFSRNLLDKDVVADALMTDFTTSTFSTMRCALADTLPATWKSADELKTAWATALGSSKLRGAASLKTRLSKKDDFDAHAKSVDTYIAACNARNTSEADKWAEDLLAVLSQRRVEFIEHYEQVVESAWLLPSDNLKSAPGKIRLNPTTCKIDEGSKPAGGE